MKNMKSAETLAASLLIAKGLVAEYLADGKVRPSPIHDSFLHVLFLLVYLVVEKETPMPSFVAESFPGTSHKIFPVHKDFGK